MRKSAVHLLKEKARQYCRQKKLSDLYIQRIYDQMKELYKQTPWNLKHKLFK